MATYVMSDLHGLQYRLNAMLEKISFCSEDVLYIVGDVIDRGEDGIALLTQCMETENIRLLMGNHEHMMLEYLQADAQLKNGVENRTYKEQIKRWNRNHNRSTLEGYYALSKEKQNAMYAFLFHLPLAYPDVCVANRHFYLVHAASHPSFTSGIVTLSSCLENQVEPYQLLWERIDGSTAIVKDRILIFGHTPTLFFQSDRPYKIWTNGKDIKKTDRICIDCGCAANDAYTQAACLRLDDLEVFYA